MRGRANILYNTATVAMRYIVMFGGAIVLLLFIANLEKAGKLGGPSVRPVAQLAP
jgi:hypothetical protein